MIPYLFLSMASILPSFGSLKGSSKVKNLWCNFKSKYFFVLGCNLSPLLFSLYVSGLGAKLNGSGLGIDLQTTNISCILFADDLVVLGKSREALENLMGITRRFFVNHKLDISCNKSKIMSHNATTGETVFCGHDLDPLRLEEAILQISWDTFELFSL